MVPDCDDKDGATTDGWLVDGTEVSCRAEPKIQNNKNRVFFVKFKQHKMPQTSVYLFNIDCYARSNKNIHCLHTQVYCCNWQTCSLNESKEIL